MPTHPSLLLKIKQFWTSFSLLLCLSLSLPLSLSLSLWPVKRVWELGTHGQTLADRKSCGPRTSPVPSFQIKKWLHAYHAPKVRHSGSGVMLWNAAKQNSILSYSNDNSIYLLNPTLYSLNCLYSAMFFLWRWLFHGRKCECGRGERAKVVYGRRALAFLIQSVSQSACVIIIIISANGKESTVNRALGGSTYPS